jgi:hypothetical protein
MLVVDEDMHVFFNADFASDWVRLAGGGSTAKQFAAIAGVQDVEGLQGYALEGDHELSYVTADVDLAEGMQLQEVGKSAIWRVRRDPQRTADGLTSLVQIGKVPV